jgi:alpha-L-fucosidase
LALFLHFGVNTFTDREWGDGQESPAIFDPQTLDARQWARSAKAAGFRSMILTAKHHDGFCLWPTATTRHSVAESPWREGKGDVVREFVTACREEGLRPGLYCSPWDRNAGVYGDSPAYNDFYVAQLTELLGNYGPLCEVWFDGANGEGPSGRKQEYDWPRFFGLVKRLQPDAVIFSDAGPDLRWIGNEKGEAGEPNWATIDPATVPFPGADGPGIIEALQHGDPAGSVWRPGESDTSIRPGWFYHPAEDARVRPVGELVQLYLSSVGRNSKLLLNVPPTRDGLLHPVDVARLAELRSALDRLLGEDLAAGRKVSWNRNSADQYVAEVDLGQSVSVGLLDLGESIATGQRVAQYRADALTSQGWKNIARGSTIGYRRLQPVAPVEAFRIRIVIEAAVESPRPLTVALHSGIGLPA